MFSYSGAFVFFSFLYFLTLFSFYPITKKYFTFFLSGIYCEFFLFGSSLA